MRLGLAGCGAIATLVHLRSARALDGVEVVALADPDQAACARAARFAPAASHHLSVDALLAGSSVDAVVVCTPSGIHASGALSVLRAERHLYLEKPIAASLEEAEEVARIARATGVVAAMGFNRRFHPLVIEARHRLAADGIAEEVTHAETVFSEPLEPVAGWKRLRSAGGGAPLDLATHHVDLLRHLLGRDAVGIGGRLRSCVSELDDCELRFALGEVTATVACSFLQPRQDRIELHGTRGALLVVDRYEGRLEVRSRPVRTRALTSLRLRAMARRTGDVSYRPALAAFVSAVRGHETTLPTIADGLASLRAIVGAEELAARCA